MHRIWSITFWFLLQLTIGSRAQNSLRFEHLNVNQGLSNHIIYAMIQDSRGYLWFATDNGLNKYDGYTLTTYHKNPNDTTSLVGNAVVRLMEDREGTIWIGMMGQGICRFDRRTERFTHYPPNPKTLQQGTIHTMGEDQYGYLWVSNGRAELRRFDKKTGQYSRFNYASLLTAKTPTGPAVTPVVHTVYCDRRGNVWTCTDTGLYRLQVGIAEGQAQLTRYQHTPTNPHSPSHNRVWEIYEDPTGLLWVSTDNGLNRLDPSTQTFTHYTYSQKTEAAANTAINQGFRYLTSDGQGYLWMGTGNDGLFRFDPRKGQFTQFVHDPVDPLGLSSDHIRSLLVDRSGLLWVGTYGEGIDKTNPTRLPFRHYRPLPYRPETLSYKFVSAILEDRTGTVWVGTGYGLNRLDKRTGTFSHYYHDPANPRSLPNRNVESLFEDRQGRLWVASRGALALLDPKTGQFTNLTRDTLGYPGLGGQARIFTIYQDRQGRLWLGTDVGAKRFDPATRQVIHYPYDPQRTDGLSDGWVLSIREDRQGYVWMGTGSVALNRFDPRTGQFKHYRPDRHRPGSITADAVSAILEDSRGVLWFGTSGGGLCRFDPKTETFRAFTQRDGLADNSIHAIEETPQGDFWLGTSKGLSRFSPTRLTVTNYDANDGLQRYGFRAAHCQGRDGTLYFGGDDGFTAFDPGGLSTNLYIPPVVVTQIKLFDKAIAGQGGTQTLDLNYDENFLSFDFAALDFHNPSKNRYAYQLVGLEPNWVYSGSRRYVNYTNLAPGRYTFRVKGSNNDGVWNESGTSIQIVIRPPWWQTTLFRLLTGISLIALLALSVRLYTKARLRRQQQDITRIIRTQETERRRLAADLHDDLGGTLATVRRRLSDIRQRLRDAEAAREIDALEPLIQKSSHDLRRIAHNLMPPEFERIGLRHALQQLVESQPAQPTRFSFLVAGQVRSLPLETELNVYRIVSELVQNVHKHAQARQAAVQVLYYDDYLSITVEDDGLGSRVAKTGNPQVGIGLKSSSLRAEYIGARLWREASEQGMLVVLDVPYTTVPHVAVRADPNFTDRRPSPV